MTLRFKKSNKYTLKSVISEKLTKKEIREICLLKDKQWKFGIKSQLIWFKNNVKNYDIHNMFYIKSKLVGYTLLRKRTCENKKLNKKAKYLLFDTLVIDKKYRGMKLSNLLMSFNSIIIKQSGFFSFLICDKKLVNFYEKNNWKKIDKKFFKIIDYPFKFNGMIFNKLNFYKNYVINMYK